MNSITSTSQWLKGGSFFIKSWLLPVIFVVASISPQSPAATSLWRWCPNGCSSVQTTKEAALTTVADYAEGWNVDIFHFKLPISHQNIENPQTKMVILPQNDMIVYIAPLKESWYDHLLDEMEVHTVVPPQLTSKTHLANHHSTNPFWGEVKQLPKPPFLSRNGFAKASAIFTGSPCK